MVSRYLLHVLVWHQAGAGIADAVAGVEDGPDRPGRPTASSAPARLSGGGIVRSTEGVHDPLPQVAIAAERCLVPEPTLGRCRPWASHRHDNAGSAAGAADGCFGRKPCAATGTPRNGSTAARAGINRGIAIRSVRSIRAGSGRRGVREGSQSTPDRRIRKIKLRQGQASLRGNADEARLSSEASNGEAATARATPPGHGSVRCEF